MHSHRSFLTIALVALAVCAAGCESRGAPNACPGTLSGAAAAEGAGSVWGDDKPNAEATIVKVAVECFPVHHAAVETEQLTRAAYTTFEIAATAAVTYTIHDESTEYIDAEALFEAVSANGVVLGSGRGSFRLVKGGNSGNVSAKIPALSDEAIRRVKVVQVRWDYGR